jgi:hypothetical protein
MLAEALEELRSRNGGLRRLRKIKSAVISVVEDSVWSAADLSSMAAMPLKTQSMKFNTRSSKGHSTRWP